MPKYMLVYEQYSNIITARKIGERVLNNSRRRVILDDEEICPVGCPLANSSEQKARHRILITCIGDLDALLLNTTDR